MSQSPGWLLRGRFQFFFFFTLLFKSLGLVRIFILESILAHQDGIYFIKKIKPVI